MNLVKQVKESLVKFVQQYDDFAIYCTTGLWKG